MDRVDKYIATIRKIGSCIQETGVMYLCSRAVNKLFPAKTIFGKIGNSIGVWTLYEIITANLLKSEAFLDCMDATYDLAEEVIRYFEDVLSK